MRYILGLASSKKDSSLYIEAAQRAFAPITDGYLLAEGARLPHVTLCSFHCFD